VQQPLEEASQVIGHRDVRLGQVRWVDIGTTCVER
jgi:hypothetical protein